MSSVKNIRPEMIRVPTLFQAASAAGKKTAFVSGKDNMVSLFAEGLDVGVSNKRPAGYLPAAPDPADSSGSDVKALPISASAELQIRQVR